MTSAFFFDRWPGAVVKCEMFDGSLVFEGRGTFDERDVRTAQRTFPGRRVEIEPEGNLVIPPAGPPQGIWVEWEKLHVGH